MSARIPVPERPWLTVVLAGVPGTIEVHARCITCGRDETFIDVPAIDFGGWLAGTLIQKVLPMIPHEQREILISGECGPCFDSLFAGGE